MSEPARRFRGRGRWEKRELWRPREESREVIQELVGR